jgi:hypothetical protein
MEGPKMHSGCLDFFLLNLRGLGGEGWGEDFLHFPLFMNVFPLCSLQVPHVFPSHSLRYY